MFFASLRPVSVRSGIATMALALLAAACDEVPTTTVATDTPAPAPSAAPAETAPPPVVERGRLPYAPVGEPDALGKVDMLLSAQAGGGSDRTFEFGNGLTVDAILMKQADIQLSIGDTSMADALGVSRDALANGGDPKVYLFQVVSEKPAADGLRLCEQGTATHVLFRQIATDTDKTMTFLPLTAAPGEAGAQACERRVFMSE